MRAPTGGKNNSSGHQRQETSSPEEAEIEADSGAERINEYLQKAKQRRLQEAMWRRQCVVYVGPPTVTYNPS